MRRRLYALVAAILVAGPAAAGERPPESPSSRLAVLGFGDCDRALLPEVTRALRAEVASVLAGELLDEEQTSRPAGGLARRSLDEVRRTLDAGRTDFLNLEVARAERLLLEALPEIDRLPLAPPRWEAWTGARVTLARLYLFAEQRPRASQLLLDILRVQEDFALNRVEHPPSMRELLEVARSVLAGLPRHELRVETTRPGATVYLNGYPVGTTPLAHRLVGGSYAVLVALDGQQSFVHPVTLGADTTLRISLESEGRFRPEAGPCFAAPSRAERLDAMGLLGAALGVERIVAVRLEALAGETYVAAALLEVSSGRELREGRVRLDSAGPPPLARLARFVLTGEAALELDVPAEAVRRSEAAAPTAPAAERAASRRPRWLAWTLAGAAAGLGGLAVYGHLRANQLERELGSLVVPGTAGLIRAEDYGRKEHLEKQAASARTLRTCAGAGAGVTAIGGLGFALWPPASRSSSASGEGPLLLLWASGSL